MGTSVHTYFKRVSDDRTSFVGTVVDTLTVSGLCSGGNIFAQSGELKALQATLDAGFDITRYDNIAYVLPQDSICLPSGVAGVGSVGQTGVRFTDGSTHFFGLNFVKASSPRDSSDHLFLETAIHELGHNLGLVHDNANVCGEAIFDQQCGTLEYGGSHSIMGLSPNVAHINSIMQYDLQWLNSSEYTTVSSSQTVNQEFTLVPMGVEGSSGLKMIRVPRGDGSFYVVEYREREGFDAVPVLGGLPLSFGGILIYHNDDNEFNNSVLLASDMQDRRSGLAQLSDGNYFDARLAFDYHELAPFSSAFYDDVNKIRITPLSISSNSVRVRVETGVTDAGGGSSQEEEPSDPSQAEGWAISAPSEITTDRHFYFSLRKEGFNSLTTSSFDIDRVEWDFESDGIVDYDSDQYLSSYHTFDEAGGYLITATIYFNDGSSAEFTTVVDVLEYLNYNLRPVGNTSAGAENILNTRGKSQFVLEIRNPSDQPMKLKISPSHKSHRKLVRMRPKPFVIRPGGLYHLRIKVAPAKRVSRVISTDNEGYYNIPLRVTEINGKRSKIYTYPSIKIKSR